MSPKSRGRPTGRGRPKARRGGPVRELRLSDRVLRDAPALRNANDLLQVELWASAWLGAAWLDAPMGERQAEHLLCLEVAGRAATRPGPDALAALVALRRVAPEGEHKLLDEAIEVLSASEAPPPWQDAPAPVAVRAWRAVDVWDSERMLFVDYPGHTLVAYVTTTSGTMVEKLADLPEGSASAWDAARVPGDTPMPVVEAPADEVLAELASALRSTDMMWPRQDDEDFVALRALTWARSRSYLPGWPDFEALSDNERAELIAAFGGDDVAASLADLFLDYGDGYLHAGPLGWSPYAVALFLTDYLPRKVVLDAAQREALPETLRRWLRFALERRGVPQPWIEPVVAAVDDHLADFTEAFDAESAWGPAKQIAAELAGRGVDLTDRAAVDQGVRSLNAERLARQLVDRDQ